MAKRKLKVTAFHELGHALAYHKYNCTFYYISISPYIEGYATVLGHLQSRSDYYYWKYFTRIFSNPVLFQKERRLIRKSLRIHVDTSISGQIAEMYYNLRDKKLVTERYMEYFFEEWSYLEDNNPIEDLIEFTECTINGEKYSEYISFDADSLENYSPYCLIDRDFLFSYLALSLYYRNNERRIIKFIKNILPQILDFTEQNFHIHDKLADVLLRKKEMDYDEFLRYYTALSQKK